MRNSTRVRIIVCAALTGVILLGASFTLSAQHKFSAFLFCRCTKQLLSLMFQSPKVFASEQLVESNCDNHIHSAQHDYTFAYIAQ
jgi:hypothetical protein